MSILSSASTHAHTRTHTHTHTRTYTHTHIHTHTYTHTSLIQNRTRRRERRGCAGEQKTALYKSDDNNNVAVITCVYLTGVGVCPTPHFTWLQARRICHKDCFFDSACPGNQKCCVDYHRCGSLCQDPVPSSNCGNTVQKPF